MKYSLTILLLVLVSISTASAQLSHEEKQVINTLQAFRQAIVKSNREAAAKLLMDKAHILEEGGIETKKKYLSHHFYADGKFLSAMEHEIKARSVFIEGNAAWVTTKSHIHGSYSGKEINLTSLELAVLKKVNGRWKIAALHWSSS